VTLGMFAYLIFQPANQHVFYAMVGLGLLIGVFIVMPIGGADMPVVISLLNSYAGLASSATGFVLGNNVLIIAGALDGASGFLLSVLMSRAMNRSFTNVLFGAFGGGERAAATLRAAGEKTVRPITVEDAAIQLAYARLVIVVPGYGMAILDVDKAKSIIVLKRSMNPGFAGIENELFYHPKCSMLFGNAKDSLVKLIGEIKNV